MKASMQLLAALLCASLCSSAFAQAPACDPYAEFLKITDASVAVNQWTRQLGLIKPGVLPQAGLTFYLASNDALKYLYQTLGGKGDFSSNLEALENQWKTLDENVQKKVISIFLNQLIYTVQNPSNESPFQAQTALTGAHPTPGFTLLVGKDFVKTPMNQNIQLSQPYLVCRNLVYIVTQILMPTEPLKLPETTLEQAQAIISGMAAAVQQQAA